MFSSAITKLLKLTDPAMLLVHVQLPSLLLSAASGNLGALTEPVNILIFTARYIILLVEMITLLATTFLQRGIAESMYTRVQLPRVGHCPAPEA